MFYVYILQSKITKRYYVGSTTNLSERLERHNSGRVRSTKPYKPWQIIFVERFPSRKEAVLREKLIKRFKSGVGLKKLIGSYNGL